MPFDAGSIVGSLDLSTVGFNHGLTEAHTHAESEGGHIREVFQALAESLGEAMGPELAGVVSGVQSALAGFAEGPVIGGINAAAIAFGSLREMAEAGVKNFDEMHLAAERTGASVEWLSREANVAHAVGLGISDLSMGFKVLEQQAELAAEGNGKAAEGFKRLGISAQQAGELAKHPQELFEAVATALGKVTDASQRTLIAKDVLSKQGYNLIPLLTMETEVHERLANASDQVGATITANQAQMGADFAQLEATIGMAWQGVEATLATDIFGNLHKNLPTITSEIVNLTRSFQGDIVEVTHLADEMLKAGGALDQLNQKIKEHTGLNFGKALREDWEGIKSLHGKAVDEEVKEMTEGDSRYDYSPYSKPLPGMTDAGKNMGAIVSDAIDKNMEAYHAAATAELAARNLGGNGGHL